jgi:ribosome maturation factor RimP
MAQRDRSAPARAARRFGRPSDPAADRGPAVDLRALRARLHNLVEPVVTAADLDLDGVTVSPAGRRLVVRVVVDGENGIGHDELSEVSRDISDALDRAEQRGGELTPGSYLLEVSSPGVDRPLTLPRHWRRNIGRLVTVRVDQAPASGRITAVGDHGVSLDAGEPIPFDRLGPGRVQVEFTHLADLDDDDFGAEFDEAEVEAVDDEAGVDEDDEHDSADRTAADGADMAEEDEQ